MRETIPVLACPELAATQEQPSDGIGGIVDDAVLDLTFMVLITDHELTAEEIAMRGVISVRIGAT